jgi:hypothetical protein
MSNDHDYPFFDDWQRQQSEPMPEFGASVFNAEPSPLTIDRLPAREKETLFTERKEKE